jgi:ribonucleoside-diphosphate reductase alpha chain
MATSILDYIFRELAISYLDRGDLAHVQPGDLLPDAVGKGEAESELGDPGSDGGSEIATIAQRAASSGYVRSKLTVVHGGAGRGPAAAFGALAVSVAPEQARDLRLERIRAARIKGYEGDSCEECGNFTLIRNGTCLKCDTCGATSGCS